MEPGTKRLRVNEGKYVTLKENDDSAMVKAKLCNLAGFVEGTHIQVSHGEDGVYPICYDGFRHLGANANIAVAKIGSTGTSTEAKIPSSYDELLQNLEERFKVESKYEEVRSAKKSEAKSDSGLVTLTCHSGWVTHENEDESSCKKLFVRSCYDELIEQIMACREERPKGGSILLGNPGIGKSWFLNYVVYYLLQQDEDVMLELAQSQTYWLFSSRKKAAYFFKLADTGNMGMCLHRCTEFTRLFDPYQCAPFTTLQFTIIASSPNPKQWKKYWKAASGADIRYIGNWRLEELRDAKFQENEDTLISRWTYFGGRPRYIALLHDKAPRQQLEVELKKAALLKAEGFNKLLEHDETGQDVSHMIIQLVPDPADNMKYLCAFASDWVETQWPLQAKERNAADFKKTLRMMLGTPILRQGCGGVVFEHYAHTTMLEQQWWKREQQVRRLLLEGGKKKSAGPIESKKFWFGDADLGQSVVPTQCAPDPVESYFYIPGVPNFPVIDSFHPDSPSADSTNNIVGYQVTINREHPPAAEKFYKLLCELGYNEGGTRQDKIFYLVFVIEDDKEEFVYQNLDWGKGAWKDSDAAKEMQEWYNTKVSQYSMAVRVEVD